MPRETTQKIREPLPGGCDIGCDTCAFRAGSDTRREPYNAMKATLCELGGVPFYCHLDRAGVDFHASEDKPPASQLRICEGWKKAMRVVAQNPVWRKNRSLRKAFAEIGIGALERLVDNDDPEDRARHMKTVGMAVRALVLKKPRKLRLVVPK